MVKVNAASIASEQSGMERSMICSDKGMQLFDIYRAMALEAYRPESAGQAFNEMEIRAFREPIRKVLRQFDIATLLDYGSGGSNYEMAGFDGNSTAREYFGLVEVYRFEPARDLDQRCRVDAVLCFDLLEHVFVADVPATVRDMFSLARKLLIVNTACYPARSILPNGENAHITVRPPLWWKGMFDSIAVEFPAVAVWLICSPAWRNATAFELYSGQEWLNSPTFVTTK
jgi:hypothetical protein